MYVCMYVYYKIILVFLNRYSSKGDSYLFTEPYPPPPLELNGQPFPDAPALLLGVHKSIPAHGQRTKMLQAAAVRVSLITIAPQEPVRLCRTYNGPLMSIERVKLPLISTPLI